MNKFDDMIHGLQQDLDMPEDVWAKYTDTLANLPEKKKKYFPGGNRWMKYGAAAAAVVVAGSGICCSNPALAAKIPILGNIFQEVQQSSQFSGEYDEHAEVLNTEITADETGTEILYTAEDSGVTVTASEIYCDGLSVFLTAKVTLEQGGLDSLPDGLLYLGGNWKTDTQESQALMNNNLEGKALDDHTFIGMVKLNLNSSEPSDNTLESNLADTPGNSLELNPGNSDTSGNTLMLDLSMVGYDDANELDAEDISVSHKIEGEWKLDIPFTVDTEAARTIPLNEENNGYSLKEVFMSPYQVISHTDVPYTQREISREEFEAMMLEKTGGSDDFGITYEEYLEQSGREYADCCTLIYNQDGELLTPTEEFRGQAVYAVQGREISSLYIYVFDNFEAWLQMEDEGMDSEAATQAVVYAEVPVA